MHVGVILRQISGRRDRGKTLLSSIILLKLILEEGLEMTIFFTVALVLYVFFVRQNTKKK